MMNLYHLYFSRPERNQKAILWSLFFFLTKRSMLFQTHHYPLECHSLVSLHKEIQPIPNWWQILIGHL